MPIRIVCCGRAGALSDFREVAYVDTVRDHLVDALYADLGPFEGAHAHDTSRELIRNPSDWYLTGFLVPDEERDAGEDTLNAEEATGEPAEDDAEDGVATTMPKLFPASMGLSVLLPKSATKIRARVSFAMYEPERVKEPGKGGQGKKFWRRVPHTPEVIELDLTKDAIEAGKELTNVKKVWVKGQLAVLQNEAPGLEAGTKALSLFVVNQQDVHEDEHRRAGRTLFQVQFELHTDDRIIARPNRSGVATHSDNDARVLDLQFRERFEYVVGHNVAAEPVEGSGEVKAVRSRWIPRSEVRLVKARAGRTSKFACSSWRNWIAQTPSTPPWRTCPGPTRSGSRG